jgi:hypothetical protein
MGNEGRVQTPKALADIRVSTAESSGELGRKMHRNPLLTAVHATFASSLERGVIRSLLRGSKKSSDCSVVTPRNMLSVRHCKQNIAMKTKLRQTTPQRSSPELLRKRAYRPDPMLRLNISFFNFTDGWARVFSKEQYGRFSS